MLPIHREGEDNSEAPGIPPFTAQPCPTQRRHAADESCGQVHASEPAQLNCHQPPDTGGQAYLGAPAPAGHSWTRSGHCIAPAPAGATSWAGRPSTAVTSELQCAAHAPGSQAWLQPEEHPSIPQVHGWVCLVPPGSTWFWWAIVTCHIGPKHAVRSTRSSVYLTSKHSSGTSSAFQNRWSGCWWRVAVPRRRKKTSFLLSLQSARAVTWRQH